MKLERKQEEGLTLMEVIIVLALIAVIGAILAPNFLNATDKAKLKSDIESARVIQNAIALHNAEQPTQIVIPVSPTVIPLPTNTVGELSSKNYLQMKNPQTQGAEWYYENNSVKVHIGGANDKVKGEIYNALSQSEKDMIITPTPSS